MKKNDLEAKKSEVQGGSSTHVRFSKEESDRIKKDASTSGKSLPALLKESYFRKNQIVLLGSKEETRDLINQVKKWGNNINQIARFMHARGKVPTTNTLEEIRAYQRRLYEILLGVYGSHKNHV